MKKNSTPFGFTLIELMLVVAIISLLAAIAIPKFANLVRKAREAATYGNLGVLRSALRIYYADTEGTYPSSSQIAAVLTGGGRYIDKIPWCDIPLPGHVRKNTLTTEPTPRGDGGNWCYRDLRESMFFVSPTDGKGTLLGINIACDHTDLKGNLWGRGEAGAS